MTGQKITSQLNGMIIVFLIIMLTNFMVDGIGEGGLSTCSCCSREQQHVVIPYILVVKHNAVVSTYYL